MSKNAGTTGARALPLEPHPVQLEVSVHFDVVLEGFFEQPSVVCIAALAVCLEEEGRGSWHWVD